MTKGRVEIEIQYARDVNPAEGRDLIPPKGEGSPPTTLIDLFIEDFPGKIHPQ